MNQSPAPKPVRGFFAYAGDGLAELPRTGSDLPGDSFRHPSISAMTVRTRTRLFVAALPHESPSALRYLSPAATFGIMPERVAAIRLSASA